MDLHILGELQGVRGIHLPNLSCHYKLVLDQAAGTTWLRTAGDTDEYTQMCAGFPVVWNHPIDVSFTTTSVESWPHAYFEVWSQDELGRNALAGYAQIALPSTPGRHDNLEAVVWRPRGSWIDRLRAAFLGGGPQLTDPEETLLHDARRFGQTGAFCTETMGVLTLSLTVAVAGDIASKGVRLHGHQ